MIIKFTNVSLFKQQFTKFINSNINWDVIILSSNNYKPFTKISDFCIKVKNSQSTLGCIVHKKYYDYSNKKLFTGIRFFN